MILLALFAGCSSSPVAPTLPRVKAHRPPDAPPNIIVLLADDAGHADFSMNGSATFRTPAIDTLAAEGVSFTNAYVTASVCSPSRAGLLTGRYQQRFGHEGNPPLAGGGPKAGLSGDETLLSEHLKKAGYATGVFGKWHLGYEPYFLPNARGFDRFEGVLRGERTYFPQTKSGAQAWMHNTERVPEDFAYVTDAIADATVDFMVENRDGPFFAYVAFTAVHSPLEALPADLKVQDPSLTGPRRNLAAMTTGMDRAVGKIVRSLDAMGLRNDTLVFFINDNGAGKRNHGDNSPWRGGKGRLFEGGIHVPYLLRWPGVAVPGSRQRGLVSSLDVVPTVLKAANLPFPTERPLDGQDLGPRLRGEVDAPATSVLYWRMGKSWAIRDSRFKLLSDRGRPPVLFDLIADPSESNDLMASMPEEAARLQGLYDAWDGEMIPPAFLSATELRRRK